MSHCLTRHVFVSEKVRVSRKRLPSFSIMQISYSQISPSLAPNFIYNLIRIKQRQLSTGWRKNRQSDVPFSLFNVCVAGNVKRVTELHETPNEADTATSMTSVAGIGACSVNAYYLIILLSFLLLWSLKTSYAPDVELNNAVDLLAVVGTAHPTTYRLTASVNAVTAIQ